MIGSTYVNKHNGKTIEIEACHITDSGTMLYYGVNTANGHGDYYTDKDLQEHWVGNAESQEREMTTKEWERKYFAEFYQWMMDRDVDTCKEFDHVWNAEHGFSTEKVFV